MPTRLESDSIALLTLRCNKHPNTESKDVAICVLDPLESSPEASRSAGIRSESSPQQRSRAESRHVRRTAVGASAVNRHFINKRQIVTSNQIGHT